MASNRWTVATETEKVDLIIPGEAEPQWLVVKKQLSIGERRRSETAGFGGMSGFGTDEATGQKRETEIGIDWKGQSFARTMEWLTDWSLKDDDGNKLPLTREVVESLRQDVYEAIETVINARVERQEQEKKARAGSRAPALT